MKAKPDHDLLLSTYHQEVARGGKAGALARAATRLGVSDETVRRARLADEQRDTLDPLAYVPCPGEKPIAPRVVPQMPHKTRHISPLLHHKRRLRVVAPLATRHIVSEDVADVLPVPSPPVLPPTRIIYRDLTPPPSLVAQLRCWFTQPGFLLGVLVASALILLSRW